MTQWLHVIALLLYATAASLLAISFARGAPRLPLVARVILGAGLAIHAWGLAAFTVDWSELPLVGLGPSLSTLAFLVGLGTLIASTVANASTVGLVLLPVVTVLLGIAAAVGVRPTGEAGDFQSGWFALHVVMAFVGYVGLTLAFATGLMYLLQFRELKSKHFGAVFRFFPPLETLDSLGRKGLLYGFPFLTLAMLAGWGWMARFADAAQSPGSPKLTWVILSWVVYLAAILARFGSGRRSQRGALASVIGFVVVVALYVVLRTQTAQSGGFL